MATRTNPYEILGTEKTANDYTLRIAFRNKIHQYKSDRLKSSGSKTINDEQFRLIYRAYETVSDYDKRNEYLKRNEWISNLDQSKYTFQQFASEPSLAQQFKKRLLNAKLSEIDAQDPITGQTPLYCAARTANIEAVQYLIEQGADPDLKQRTGSVALHAASFFGHPEIVQSLLENGANYTITNSSNNLPEKESFTPEVEQIFTKLKQTPFVQTAANQFDWFKNNISNIKEHIDTPYYIQGQTLLHCACKKGYFDFAKWFIEQHKANIDIVDTNLNSALHLAAYGGHSSIVNYLLNRGANSTLINKWGMTAEQEGIRHGTKITSLFKSIKEINMFEMAKNGILWWFQYYFDDYSPNIVDGQGSTILYVACRFGQTFVAKWLLDKGANINAQLPGIGSTPLHGAAYYNHRSTVELLLSRGADINIKNKHGDTPLNDAQSEEIKSMIKQYRDNLSGEKYLSVHLYGDGSKSGNDPIAKVQLHCDATINDLIKALPNFPDGCIYEWFSVARSPLNSTGDDNKLQLVSAFCRARHVNTKFVDLPMCLIAYSKPRYTKSGYKPREPFPISFSRTFKQPLVLNGKNTTFNIDGTSKNIQTFKIENIIFNFPPNCANDDISIEIKYLMRPNAKQFDISECVCMFETNYQDKDVKLDDMPIIFINNESNVKLYTKITNSAHWFSYSNQENRLPYIGGLHALVRHVEIIPKQLYLLPDMFLQSVLGSPLQPIQNPIPCQYLKIRDHNIQDFPHTAYHGTSIGVIRSILLDGLVMANTVVQSGIRVCPPPNHISRGISAFGIDDFANALFVSPSIHYCSDPVYAVQFTNGDQATITVLECRIKDKTFNAYPSTVTTYVQKPGDDIKEIEWRITCPAHIQITGVLFIPVIKSIIKSAKDRAGKLGLDPNAVT